MDHVDPDPIRAPLESGHARHLGECCLGGRVRGRAGTGGRDVFRADHHDPAAAWCELQERMQVMQEHDRGFDIDAHRRTPRSHVQGIKALTWREDAGVEDGDIDATETLDRGLNRAGHLFGIGHVAPEAEPCGSGGRFCNFRVHIQTDDRCAVLEQELRAGATDTRSRSCDQRDLADELAAASPFRAWLAPGPSTRRRKYPQLRGRGSHPGRLRRR